jgi:3-phosphoshikimate 1-carboxyvinyltransferase
MTLRRVTPGRVVGRVRAPPSKSYTHRALLAAHLSGRRSTVDRPLDADDTRATARAISSLGSQVVRARQSWTVRPAPVRRRPRIDCGASGTTLRLAAAIAALRPGVTTFTGTARLGERPMSELLAALRTLGAECAPASPRAQLPLRIRGPLRGGRVSLNASESSQFVSALLLALPTCPRDSIVRLRGEIVSEPYIAATRAVLRFHGVSVRPGRRVLRIPGGQRYAGARFQVPGDASSAAYLWVAAAVTGGDVRVDDVPAAWPQADLAILDVLRRFGARVDRSAASVRVRGDARRPFSVDLTASPDLYPLVGVLAACTSGTSRLRGAAHVVLKESDRRAGTSELARALGAAVRPRAGGLDIQGSTEPSRVELRALDDHRTVMSAAVGALAAEGPSQIGDARAVRKSFPEFWSVLDRLTRRVGSP